VSEVIAVLGAGNGGYAAAADLTLRGYSVHMFNPRRESLEPIIERGGIKLLEGDREDFAEVSLVTTDIEEALAGAHVVLVVVPVTGHEFYAELLAPHLEEDHVVFLNPGHTGGGLHFVQTLRRLGVVDSARTCEASTLSYGCRITAPAEVTFYMRPVALPFAAFPGKYADELFSVMQEIYPCLVLKASVLDTAFMNVNAIEHPPQILCNAGWVEHTAGSYYFYYEGTTPSVGRVIDAVDGERMATAQALRAEAKSFAELFFELGYTTKKAFDDGSAYALLHESAPNRWVKGPKSLDHRYVHEDVGYGLVPWAGLATLAGVPTPTMDSLIQLASVMNRIDYASQGRTLDKLGLAGVPMARLEEYLYEGHV
jgi:opine dehydrogenase